MRRRLRHFWEMHPKAETPLRSWYSIADKAVWKTPPDIKDAFSSADFVGDNRVIFNIGGNNYRLIVRVSYTYERIMIKFIGTHAEYDKINPEQV